MLLISRLAGEKLAPSIAVLDSTEAPEDASKVPETPRLDDIPVGVSTSAKLLNEGSPSTAIK